MDVDRAKPCGYDGHCPLVDEHRLFYEAAMVLEEAGMTRKDSFMILAVAIKKWCKKIEALEIHPAPRLCRDVMEDAAKAWAQDRNNQVRGFIISLNASVKALEHAETGVSVADIKKALEAATF